MMSSWKKRGRKSKSSPTRTYKYNLTWHADFWQFYQDNRQSIDCIIRSNIQATFLPTADVSLQDLENDILIKLYESDFLRQFRPDKSKLSTYLTLKVRYYIKHAIDKISSRSRLMGQRMLALGINSPDPRSYYPSEYSELVQLKDTNQTDDLAIESSFVSRIAEGLSGKALIVLELKVQDYNLTDIAHMLGYSVEYIRQLKEKVYKRARVVLKKALDCKKRKRQRPKKHV